MTKKQSNKSAFSAMFSSLSIILVMGFSSLSYADTMSIPVSEQGNSSVHVPKNGQKMDNVESQYGTPLQRVAAVGEPPISRWVYSDFTVYFENEIVLHAVIHKN